MKKKREEKKIGDEVTITQSFAAQIFKEGGDARLQVKSNTFYIHQLNKFKNGEQVTLYVTNRRAKRTLSQNAYYWGVYLPLIAAETGEQNLDRLHELFKGLFLTKGIVEVLGRKVRIKGSTTNLSVGDFCDYIMKIQGETGVEAPPTENYGLEALPRKKAKKK